MRVCFFHSDKPRERLLAEAFLEGIKVHGDEGVARALTPESQIASDCEAAVMVGVKSKELFRDNWRGGVHTVMLDKGYTRHSTDGNVRAWEYWRVAVDAHQPTHYLDKVARPSDRAELVGLRFVPWRKSGHQVLIAGSSAKYHDFYDLADPTAYALKLVKRLRGLTGRRLVYRPKPSWKEAVAVKGADFDQQGSILDALSGAHAIITHGSNAVFEAMICGVPSIVLGDAVMKNISSTTLEEINKPRLASDDERWQTLCNLAYCQWTLQEMQSGEAWRYIRPQIFV